MGITAQPEFEAMPATNAARSAIVAAKVNPKNPKRVTTGVVRIVYPNLAESRPAEAEIDPGKYTVLVLIPKSDTDTVEKCRAAIEFAALEKFKKMRPDLVLPMKDGDAKVDKDGEPVEFYQGHWYFNLKSTNPPKIIDPMKNTIANPSFIKGGDWGRVQIAFNGYDQSGKRGVGSYINVFQFAKSGDPLGGGDALEDFDEMDFDDVAF